VKIKNRHLILRLVAVVVTLALCLITVRRCLYQVQQEQRRQVEQNLRDVARQNAGQLRSSIGLRMKYLEAMSVQMSGEKDPVFIVDEFKPLVELYNAKKIGFVFPDGESYATDDFRSNVRDRPFFQKSIRGEPFISDVEKAVDGIGDVVVQSLPVYSTDGKQVDGVLYIVYYVEVFNNLLHVDSFEGQGTSCVIRGDGYVVAAPESESLNAGDNLFQRLAEQNSESIDEITRFDREMLNEGIALGTFSNGTEDHFLYALRAWDEPGYEPWYLITIIPADMLSQRAAPMMDSIQRMLFVVAMLLLLCGLVYLWTVQEQRRQLYRLAYQDSLTGLDNYSAFREKMRRGTGVSGAGYVVSADLRGFGTINNTCGVPKGDELLREMGRILLENTERGELAAHVSGDRFVLFLHSESQEALVKRITALRETIANLSPLLEVPHVVPQFGIRAVDDPNHPEQSYSDANLTKQRLKERADYFYSFFDGEIRERNLEIQQMEDNFYTALEQRQFEVWYQPKYDPVTGMPVAAEALVRWRRPDGTLVPPGKFITLFEHNGMISQLDEYTFETVCAQQRAWLDEGKTAVPVSVNVSRASLLFPDIVARYMVLARRNNIDTDCIELEITESAIEGNRNIEELIRQFRSCGFRILVDDFGSGYSSMSTLTKKYFDNIKIDKSLTDCIGTPEGDSLLGSIVHMAHEFHMTVTAEGVEEKRQVDFLVGLSCDNIQGYYYSKPLPMPDFATLLIKAEGSTVTFSRE